MDKSAPKRKYFEIGRQIEELLHSGVFKVGQRLPSERELSEQLETSRATIREAIIMLELKGLVNVKKGAGIFFTDSPKKKNQRSFTPISDVGPFELLQARQILESSIAAFAASQIKFNELKELKKVLKRQENEINRDSEKFENLDQEFHRLIAESTQNRVLIQQARNLWNLVRTKNPLWKELNHKYLHEERLQNLWIEDHKKILFALQKKSPETARQAVWQHIENSKQELLKLADLTNNDESMDDYFFAAEMDN